MWLFTWPHDILYYIVILDNPSFIRQYENLKFTIEIQIGNKSLLKYEKLFLFK